MIYEVGPRSTLDNAGPKCFKLEYLACKLGAMGVVMEISFHPIVDTVGELQAGILFCLALNSV
jgi:hypothetical protein